MLRPSCRVLRRHQSRLLLVASSTLIAASCGEQPSDDAADLASDRAGQEIARTLEQEMSGATASSYGSVKPVFKCVEKLSSTSYRAHFGYTNSSSTAVSIPIGFNNRFYPNPQGRGQPTSFLPGAQADVVQATFPSSSAVAWVLGYTIQIATTTSAKCPASTGSGGAGAGGKGGIGAGGAGGKGGAAGAGGRGGAAGANGGGAGGSSPKCPSTCDDHNPCTVDICNATTSFQCSNVAVANGTACNDGDACTTGDICLSGVCTAGTPRTCVATDQCHTAGTCASATGLCSNPPVADGSSCNDGNACTTGDTCQAGTCRSGSPKVCLALDQCHAAGTCAPATGLCSNPALPDGSVCDDGNRCSTGDACLAGACTPVMTLSATHCAGSACDACSFDPEVGNCFAGTDGCDSIDDAADRQLCETLYACFTDPVNSCVAQGDAIKCWCGTNPSTCATDDSGATMANGPCLGLVTLGAKLTPATYNAQTIKARLVDPAYPLGRAVNLTTCRGTFCSVECGVP